jgi:hypothetical protein
MAPGKPTQNGFIESLCECLIEHLFIILPEARKSIEARRIRLQHQATTLLIKVMPRIRSLCQPLRLRYNHPPCH